jgi:nucleosome binding factor SPN SPT16 subunit
MDLNEIYHTTTDLKNSFFSIFKSFNSVPYSFHEVPLVTYICIGITTICIATATLMETQEVSPDSSSLLSNLPMYSNEENNNHQDEDISENEVESDANNNEQGIFKGGNIKSRKKYNKTNRKNRKIKNNKTKDHHK